jgi:hypothetical protein
MVNKFTHVNTITPQTNTAYNPKPRLLVLPVLLGESADNVAMIIYGDDERI